MYRITGKRSTGNGIIGIIPRRTGNGVKGIPGNRVTVFHVIIPMALFFLVPRDETGWGWDHGSNEDDSDEMVRLHYPLARQHAVPGVRCSNVGHWRPVGSRHLYEEATIMPYEESRASAAGLLERREPSMRSETWGPAFWEARRQAAGYA